MRDIGRRARPRARPRRRPPRRQARQRAAARRRRGQARRPRHRRRRRPDAHHPERHRARHRRLHGARAAGGQRQRSGRPTSTRSRPSPSRRSPGGAARSGRTAVEIAHQVANEGPPDIRDVSPELPAGVGEALRRGMAQDPGAAAAVGRRASRASWSTRLDDDPPTARRGPSPPSPPWSLPAHAVLPADPSRSHGAAPPRTPARRSRLAPVLLGARGARGCGRAGRRARLRWERGRRLGPRRRWQQRGPLRRSGGAPGRWRRGTGGPGAAPQRNNSRRRGAARRRRPQQEQAAEAQPRAVRPAYAVPEPSGSDPARRGATSTTAASR